MKNHDIDGTRLIRSNVEYTSTAFEIPGKRIVKNIGVISGFSQSNIVSQGGIAAAIVKKLTDKTFIKTLKNDAFEDLLRTAEKQGANAIIGIQMEISSLSGSGVMNNYSNVFCNIIGTAVFVESETERDKYFQNEGYISATDDTPVVIPDSTEKVIDIIEDAESCIEIYEVIENFLSSAGTPYDEDLLNKIKEKVSIERMYGRTVAKTRDVKDLAIKLLEAWKRDALIDTEEKGTV